MRRWRYKFASNRAFLHAVFEEEPPPLEVLPMSEKSIRLLRQAWRERKEAGDRTPETSAFLDVFCYQREVRPDSGEQQR